MVCKRAMAQKIKRLNCWTWPMKSSKNSQEKYIYIKAELLGSAHIETELDRAESYPRQLATLDPTWSVEAASDQNFGRRTNDLLHITEKVVNFSLRPPAFDLLFLVTKRSQMKNYDLSVTNSGGHKIAYFL